MKSISISYFVYTSGEKGQYRGLDWGVKHASPALGEHQKLHEVFNRLIDSFSLSVEDLVLNKDIPPEQRDDVGLLALPWQGGGALLAFLLPGRDHGERRNCSIVACLVSEETIRHKKFDAGSFRDSVREIWDSNDIREIARHGGTRPPELAWNCDSEASGKGYPFVTITMGWPGRQRGYLFLDRKVSPLEGGHESGKFRTHDHKKVWSDIWKKICRSIDDWWWR